MTVATSRKSKKDNCKDLTSLLFCKKNNHKYISSSEKSEKSICGRLLKITESDLILYKCNKTKQLYVVVKCPSCGQLIEVCEIGDLHDLPQQKVLAKKLNVDNCKNY